MDQTKQSRRSFFKFGLGTAAAATGAKALAETCGIFTGEQPLGPFFPNAGTPTIPVNERPNENLPPHLSNDNDLTYVNGKLGKAEGQVAIVKGRVLDNNCEPISGASIIIWQASATGKYNHNGDGQNEDFRHPITGKIIKRKLDPNFQFWGRAVSNIKGEYVFKTIVPGFYPADVQGGWYRPPHIHFLISAMGYNQLVTQMYFNSSRIADNDFIQDLNQKDYLLQSGQINNEQRKNLVVDFKPSGNAIEGNFDITLSRG